MGNDDEGWKGFLKLCTQIQNIELLDQLFGLFFTFEERETMSSRYQIIKALLDSNLTQREISEKIGVSIAQITRGSNALKGISSDFKKTLKEKIDAKE